MAIKVVVFDYDLTLYNITPEYYNVWDDYTNKMLPVLFGAITQAEFFKLTEAFEMRPPHTIEKVARACLYQFGTAEPLLDYLFNNPYEQDYKNMRYVSNEVIKDFAQLAPLYIVSNAPANNIERQLKQVAQINTSLFKAICTNPHKACCPDKSYVLKQIMQVEGIEPNEMLMIGDSLHSDIMPAKKMGCHTYQIKNINELPKIISFLKQEQDNNANFEK